MGTKIPARNQVANLEDVGSISIQEIQNMLSF